MRLRIGVAIAQRAGDLAVLEVRRGKASLLFERHVERGENASPSVVLEALLAPFPIDLHRPSLSIALSWGEFACADPVPLPGSIKPEAIDKIAPGLCESLSAGEVQEDLSIDAVPSAKGVHALALRSEILSGLLSVAQVKGLELALVTATPIALAQALGPEAALRFVHGGEEIRIQKQGAHLAWRSFPVIRTTGRSTGPNPALQGLATTPAQASAVAVALADPLRIPNVLRGRPGAPRTFGTRFRRPLIALAAAAAFLFLSLGLLFRAAERRCHLERQAAIVKEVELWKKFLPERPLKPGELVRAMKEVGKDSGGLTPDSDFPSALAFWAEIARHLPEVEPIGMTLESLDLTPEGGRLSAVVLSAAGDPLKNAALLEGKLGLSARLSARGDYEAREKDVQVRLKMEYRKSPLTLER